MRLKRFGTLVAVLLTTSACSQLPMGPTAYSALPSDPRASLPPAAVTPAGPEADVALAPVVIPGTWKRRDAETGRGAVNPVAVLESSARSRMAWKPLRPEDLLDRRMLATRSYRSAGTDIVETSSTAKGGASAADTPRISAEAPASYNREATMNALLKGGQIAARSICSGC